MSRPPIDPGSAPTSDPGSAPTADPTTPAPRRSAAQAVLVYTAGRIVAFLVSLGFLRLLGFHTYALFLGALLLSALLSLVLLRRQRAAVSESLATRPRRDALTPRPSGPRSPRSGGDTDEVEDTDAYDPYADDDDPPEADVDPDPDASPTSGVAPPPRR